MMLVVLNINIKVAYWMHYKIIIYSGSLTSVFLVIVIYHLFWTLLY